MTKRTDHAKGNSAKLVLASFFNRLGDALASGKTVLTWVMVAMGAPTILVGLLVPIREAGALLPQIFVSGWARAFSKRKGLLAISIVIQAACVLMIAIAAQTSSSSMAIWVLLLVAAYSVSRSVSSLCTKDVLAKVVEKGERGALMGVSAMLAGLMSLGFGVGLMLGWLRADFDFLVLLIVACLSFLLSAMFYFSVQEPRAEVEGLRSWRESLKSGWLLMGADSTLSNFLLVRGLLVSSSLALPYLVVVAQRHSQAADLSAINSVGVFIAVTGFAGLISGRFWGMLSDKDSRWVLTVTAAATSLICLLSLACLLWLPNSLALCAALLFGLLSVVHQGVRLGRETYVVDITEGNKRSDYVAIANTVIGLVLIIVGAIGALIAQWSIAYVFVFYSLLSGLASWRATQMSRIS